MTNATAESRALNRHVEFILLGTVKEPMNCGCGAGRPSGGNLDGGARDSGSRVSGTLGSKGYNCATGERTENSGRLNVVNDDSIGTQGMASFGIHKERPVDSVLRGRFIEGDITGVGVHAGVFGAHATDGGLVSSHYESAAVGRHDFELGASRNAVVSYAYAGIFLGGTLISERQTESFTLKPRAGIDLGHSRSFGEDVSTTVTLEIEPATYARDFF